MKIIISDLSVKYSGRGESTLPRHKRMLLIKDDGTISIHNGKGYKPINYMMRTSGFEETIENNVKTWTFYADDEALEITLHEIYEEHIIDLPDGDPGLTRSRTEDQLQEWLYENLEKLTGKYRVRAREYETGDGPVDILAENIETEVNVAVEVKRIAAPETVAQIVRYVDALKEFYPDRKFEGVIAALEIKDKTFDLARRRGIECVVIPASWSEDYAFNKAMKNSEPTLFDIL